MGVFVVCRNCGQRVYLQVAGKNDLSFTFRIFCPFCSTEHTFYQSEATEERWDFNCPVCAGRFFIRNSPPRRVRCPYCASLIVIDETRNLAVQERGQQRVPAPGTKPIAGAFGGALLGGVIAGPLGAILGLVVGGALGASAEYLEAKEE